jgi:purine-binding chemotaxis protein CheW
MTEQTTTADARQYLTCQCAGEEYGVDILRVQEIKGWDGATRVPRTAAHLLGVMNLRGTIVPVVDLRRRFGLEARAFTAATVVVVVRVHVARGEKTVGLVVDAVSDVSSFEVSQVSETPRMGGHGDVACVASVATAAGKMVMLLDIDELMKASLGGEPDAARAQ